MNRNSNKVVIIVAIVIAVLAVIGASFAYMYFCTDIFRTNQELFAKYLIQNVDKFENITNKDKIAEINNKINQNQYEENMTVKLTDPNKEKSLIELTTFSQNDSTTNNTYKNIQLLMDENDTLDVEYIKEQDTYALRFTKSVKQFLSIEKDNIKELLSKLKISESTEQTDGQIDGMMTNKVLGVIDTICTILDTMDTINFTDNITLTEEEKNIEMDKYINIIYNSISKEKYTKTKKVVITVNGSTVTTNAYVLNLSEQDINNIKIKILENLKQDEIILAKLQILGEAIQQLENAENDISIKDEYEQSIQDMIDSATKEETQEKNYVITVYEMKGQTIRTKIEQGLEYITIDAITVDNKEQIDIKYSNIDEYNTQSTINFKLVKESDSKLIAKIKTIQGEEQTTAATSFEFIDNGNNIKLVLTIDCLGKQIIINRDINIVQQLEFRETLNNTNNIVLNQLQEEQLKHILSLVINRVNEEYVEPISEKIILILAEIMQDTLNQNMIPNTNITENEKNNFNEEIKSYEGTGKSGEEVNILLNKILINNTSETNSAYLVSVSGDVVLDIANTTIEKNADISKKYTIKCEYNGLGYISNVVITEEMGGTIPSVIQ